MKELENGFSVSETSDDDIHSYGDSSRGGALNSVGHQSPMDVLGLNSHYRRPQASNNGGLNLQSRLAQQPLDLESQVRLDQQRALMQTDLAAAK